MFKLLVNEKKRNVFINFWELKSIEDYHHLLIDANLIFYFFLKLTPPQRYFLGFLLKQYLEENCFKIDNHHHLEMPLEKPLPLKKLDEVLDKLMHHIAHDVSNERQDKIYSNLPEMINQDVDFLDTIGFLQIMKDRSLLEHSQDKIVLAKELVSFFAAYPILIEPLNFFSRKVSCEKDSMTSVEKKHLDRFAVTTFYHQGISSSEKQIFISLLKRNFILVAFNRFFQPAAYINPALWSIKGSIKADVIPPINKKNLHALEDYPSFLYAVEKNIYERVKKKKILNASAMKSTNPIEMKASMVARYFIWQDKSATFVKKDFKQKTKFLLQELQSLSRITIGSCRKNDALENYHAHCGLGFRKNFQFNLGIEILASLRRFQMLTKSQKKLKAQTKDSQIATSIPGEAKITWSNLLALINQRRFCLGRDLITMTTLQKGLERLELFSMLKNNMMNDEHYVFFYDALLQELFTASSTTADIAVVDSDNSIMLYKDKEHFSFAALYFLYRFCRVSVADHIITALPDMEKVSFGYFCDLSPSSIKLFLKSISESRYHHAAADYVDYLFNQAEIFKTKPCFAIQTYSQELFNYAEHELKQKFSSDVTIVYSSTERTIIFLQEKTYRWALGWMQKNKWMCFETNDF